MCLLEREKKKGMGVFATHGRLMESVRYIGPTWPVRVTVCTTLMAHTSDELMVTRMMKAMKAR